MFCSGTLEKLDFMTPKTQWYGVVSKQKLSSMVENVRFEEIIDALLKKLMIVKHSSQFSNYLFI